MKRQKKELSSNNRNESWAVMSTVSIYLVLLFTAWIYLRKRGVIHTTWFDKSVQK